MEGVCSIVRKIAGKAKDKRKKEKENFEEMSCNDEKDQESTEMKEYK